jgi:hypothetical protein
MADGSDSRRIPAGPGGVEPRSASLAGPIVGWCVAHDERGLLVDFPGNPAGPVAALAMQTLDLGAVATAIAQRTPALLTFEQGRADRPIVLGLLHDVAAPVPAPALADVDGKRVVLSAEDEIVLQCGRASITLRRNGRVVIRGVEVETRASGVNRIRGGTVAIN